MRLGPVERGGGRPERPLTQLKVPGSRAQGLLGSPEWGRESKKASLPSPHAALDGGDDAPASPKGALAPPPQPVPSKFNMSSVDKYRPGETSINEWLLEAAGQLTIMEVFGFLLETQTAHSSAEIAGWRNRALLDGNTRPG